MYLELSKKALDICKVNYAKKCGDCEIRNACVASIPPGKEGHDKWTTAVNELAEGNGAY